MTEKEKYRMLCEKEESIPVFSKAWWLDAVCGEENWHVLLYEENGRILASFPYFRKRKYKLLDIITMPPLTQIMGPWLYDSSNIKPSERISLEKKIYTQFIKTLPDVDYFSQQFHYSITNWLPFYWMGFKQTTLYTYIIKNLKDIDEIQSNFNVSKKSDLNKAKKVVTIKFDLSAEAFYKLHTDGLKKQSREISYSFDLFKRIYDSGYENKAARILYAVDIQNNIIGAVFVIWDKNSAYNLITAFDPEFRNSGVSALLLSESCNYLRDKTKQFDLEGSMIEPIEHSYRQFGALQTPYFMISKNNSRLLKIYNLVFNKEI